MSLDPPGFCGLTSRGQRANLRRLHYVVSVYTNRPFRLRLRLPVRRRGWPPRGCVIFGSRGKRTSVPTSCLLTVLARAMIFWHLPRWDPLLVLKRIASTVRPALAADQQRICMCGLASAAGWRFAMCAVCARLSATLRGIRQRNPHAHLATTCRAFVHRSVSRILCRRRGRYTRCSTIFVRPSTVALAQSFEGVLMMIAGGVVTCSSLRRRRQTLSRCRNVVTPYRRWQWCSHHRLLIMIFAPSTHRASLRAIRRAGPLI